MHPALMKGKPSGMIIMSSAPKMELEMEMESERQDPIMDMIDCMRKKDISGCLRALAAHFAKESTETPED